MSAPAPRVAPWEDFILRFIAIYKMLHALFFIGVGIGLLKLRPHNVVEVLNNHLILPYHLNPEGPFVDWMLTQAQKITPHTLLLLGYAAFLYAALFAAEGIGLYRRARWAEWMVVCVTGSLLPLEIYELFVRVMMWKIVAVIGNLLIVGYLIHRILLDTRLKAQKAAANGGNQDRPTAPAASSSGQAVSSTGAVTTKTS